MWLDARDRCGHGWAGVTACPAYFYPPERPTMKYKGMCAKCRKRQACKTPCAFVDAILRQDNRPVFEKEVSQDRIEARPRSTEVRESDFIKLDSTGELSSQDMIDAVFSTETDSPFRIDDYVLDRTQVFYRHFFRGESYEDLAEIYDTTPETIRGIYGNALTRLLYALDLLDKRLPVVDNAEYYFKRAESITGKLPKNQRHFLLAKLFGLTPKEIENFDGTKQGDVAKNVTYVADRLRTGEALFLDPDELEIKESERRLERFRATQRKAKCDKRKREAA
jgi:hypothetical protein